MHKYVIVTAGLVTASFFLGRLSHKVWKYRDLERIRQELICVSDRTSQTVAKVRRKEEEVRQKWQDMVCDISRLDANLRGDDGSKWLPQDDVFLASWLSAER